MSVRRLPAVLIAAAFATASCTTNATAPSLPASSTTLSNGTAGAQSTLSASGSSSSPVQSPPPSSPSPSLSTSAPSPAVIAGDTKTVAKAVHADELGLVPVLMYHQLVANPGKDRYNQTPAAFRAELTMLQKDGYVPITAAQFAAGVIDVPAGKHPVVLTFDDATNSQFELDPDGTPLPDTAVGIMQAFAAVHPEFVARATFFVNDGGFSKTPHAFKWLADNGFEVAVHTVHHANLGKLTDAQVQKEIGDNFQTITAAIGAAPTTFALPFGVHPNNHALELSGASGGTSYSIKGVFLVGSDPSKSPFRKGFDAAKIHRIRSQSTPGADAPYESLGYLTNFEKHPERLFTSDGDPKVVSFPKTRSGDLGPLPAGVAANAY